MKDQHKHDTVQVPREPTLDWLREVVSHVPDLDGADDMEGVVRAVVRAVHSAAPQSSPEGWVPDKETIELAKEVWLTLQGNRGYNLTLTNTRLQKVAFAFLKLAAPEWSAAQSAKSGESSPALQKNTALPPAPKEESHE